jgi:hypothetical protein
MILTDFQRDKEPQLSVCLTDTRTYKSYMYINFSGSPHFATVPASAVFVAITVRALRVAAG